MNLQNIDLMIIVVFAVSLLAVAIYAKRFNKSVADFLVANRCAGRYLLTINNLMTAISALSVVAMFEMYYKGGFCANWWSNLCMPVALLAMVSGWINYRFRETRAITMAQFYEIRYSRNLRVVCGIMSWLAGMLNIGLFPAVAAKFFMYFCGLPETFTVLGVTVSTFVAIMIIELVVAVCFTFLGGLVVVVMTNFIQGVLSSAVILVIVIFLLFFFDWDQIVTAMAVAPDNASLVHPYKTSNVEGFNMAFFLMSVWFVFYSTGVSQTGQTFVAAAKNAHEAKMAGIIGVWRGITFAMMVLSVAVCAYTFMHHPDFASKSEIVTESLSSIPDPQIQKQAIVTLVLTKVLPMGLIGLFVVTMIAFVVSTDNSVLLTWGSVFIQDVILPFRKKGFGHSQHIWLLRFSILFVAIFCFFFSLLFKQTEYLMMYSALTIGIIVSGFGAIIIGGLYWKNGSAIGAWFAVIVGCTFSLVGLVIQTAWSSLTPTLLKWFPNWQLIIKNPDKFPLNGMEIAFYASICAIICYILGSLWSWLVLKQPAFNIEKMLHRGKYAIKGEHEGGVVLPETGLKTLLPGKEFTKVDKVIYYTVTGSIVLWFVFFVIMTLYHFIFGTSDGFWIGYSKFILIFTVVAGIGTTLWLTIGGLIDFNDLIKRLRTNVRYVFDDGRVMDHHSVTDVKLQPDQQEKGASFSDAHVVYDK